MPDADCGCCPTCGCPTYCPEGEAWQNKAESLVKDITALRDRVGEGWIVRRLNEILDRTPLGREGEE